MRPDHFDAVVIGSGFGGSVTAYRLAEAGLRVCVLERGQAYPPGSFPRAPHAVRRGFWDPSEGTYGMYDVWSFKGLEALVSSALGGGSIIYANVLLRKDEKWFVREDLTGGGYEYWPVTRAELDPHYDRVERMMKPQRYPFEHAPYDATPKTRALREAAETLGYAWHLPPLAVTFGNEGAAPVPGEPIPEAHPNLHGRTRYTCRLCGECDIGCNYGSKNTLDYNYLSEAKRLGAEIRTLCEVKAFEPHNQGFVVWYVEHDPAGTSEGRPRKAVTADRLIVAAGTLGSTYLLMKNRAAFPNLSDRLGSRFCGNGDLLAFALNARCPDPATGRLGPRVLDPNFGPVITSTLRVGDALDGDGAVGRGFYLQDAGYPAFLSWIVESADVFGAFKRFVRLVRNVFRARLGGDTNLSREVQDLVGGTLSSCAVPLLGMGRDLPTGRFSMEGKWLQTDWRLDDSKAYFDRLKGTMREVADYLEADFVVNPTWLLKRVITVHPLGGCPMGRGPHEGVVDAHGQVFGHPNLYVADGAILPGPVGPNPALTIAALADRIADGILAARSGRAGAAVSVPSAVPPSAPPSA